MARDKTPANQHVHWYCGEGAKAEIACGYTVAWRRQYSRVLADVSCPKCRAVFEDRERRQRSREAWTGRSERND